MAYQTSTEKQTKSNVIEKYKVASSDTGSPEVQVALLTQKIENLTKHMRINKKDFGTQRGLLKAVGNRRRMLDYLKKFDPQRYLKLIKSLELRK